MNTRDGIDRACAWKDHEGGHCVFSVTTDIAVVRADFINNSVRGYCSFLRLKKIREWPFLWQSVRPEL